jgi:hypothetical protein
MSKSLEQFLFEAQRLTPDERRQRLERLDPNGPTLAAAHDEKLKAALHNNVFLIGVSADVCAQRTAHLGKQIADELVLEFEALQLATRGAEQRERIAAMNAGWFPMQGTTPEVQTENLRAALELIRPKFAPTSTQPPAHADVQQTEIPDDFGIPETETDISLNRVIEIARKWKFSQSDSTIRNRATKFFKRDDGASDYNANGSRYIFERKAAIDFLTDLKRTSNRVPD